MTPPLKHSSHMTSDDPSDTRMAHARSCSPHTCCISNSMLGIRLNNACNPKSALASFHISCESGGANAHDGRWLARPGWRAAPRSEALSLPAHPSTLSRVTCITDSFVGGGVDQLSSRSGLHRQNSPRSQSASGGILHRLLV